MLTALLLLAAINCHAPEHKPSRDIDGVFIEVDGDDWSRVVKSTSIDEVVIANIKGFDDGTCSKGCKKFDQAKKLIDAARPGMKIYVGLVYDAKFSIEKDGSREREVAHEFYWSLNNDQRARITGWYIAGEWHNDSDKDYQRKVITYLNAATDRKGTKPLPKGEVVVAPFFVIRHRPDDKTCDTVLGPDDTAKMFGAILAATPVTRVLLQDGFGARNQHHCVWGDDVDLYQKRAKTYIDGVAGAMPVDPKTKKPRVEFAVDLEAFGDAGEVQCRLDLQFHSVPKGARVIVYEHRACCVTALCQ